MSWRSRGIGESAWRRCLTPLRQEVTSKGYVSHSSLHLALENLRTTVIEVQDDELAEDLPFLVQQLVGPQQHLSSSSSGGNVRDNAPHLALCRLLTLLTASRNVYLHGPAANLVLSALRQWSDAAYDGLQTSTADRHQNSTVAASATSTNTPACTKAAIGSNNWTTGTGANRAGSPSQTALGAAPPLVASLPLEALTALTALLPDHLGLLSEHERAGQLTALLSLLVPQLPQLRGLESAKGRGAAEVLELQLLALNTLAACCGRVNDSGKNNGGLTTEEATALLSAAVSLLQSYATRSRPVEDAAHCRLYAALIRALQAAIGDTRQAWVVRAAMLVEGLQRFLTYGVQASLAAAAAVPTAVAAATTVAAIASSPADGGGSSGRYRPPHLRRHESKADGGLGWSDSDVSDTEHGAGASAWGAASGTASATAVVDRFRSSRVRVAVLSCIQAMAKSDPRAMHSHWSALLPLQNPLQPRPLTPNLITVLLFDPLTKVRALSAATLSSLLDGPAQRSILAVAEAKSMTTRAPVRGFLTLSLSLGQLLLAAHAGLLKSVADEGSPLVLPAVLRALVVLMAASPYERLPPELLPETLKVLRTRWSALTDTAPAAQSSAAAGELGPIQAAYLACLAECFSTKQPIAGLSLFLQQQQEEEQCSSKSTPTKTHRSGGDGGAAGSGCAGSCGGGDSTGALIHDLLVIGRDASVPAVLRIEALAALKGLATHYTAVLPSDVWEDLHATATVGLSISSSPRALEGAHSGPLLRSSSSSSVYVPPSTHGSVGRAGNRMGPRLATSNVSDAWGSPVRGTGGTTPLSAAGQVTTSSANSSPEDKAAQLSLKLLSDYLSAMARQYGINRADHIGGAGDGDGGPPPSPGFVPLAAAVGSRQHLQQQAVSPKSERSEEESEEVLRQLATRWQDAIAVIVPPATSHASYMVRAAGLACFGDVPESVFSRFQPQLQQQMLALLSAAAATDTVPAVRAAACKALGTSAAFPAVLAQPSLSDRVTRALLPCLRDKVLSVRIAAGWAVANLCDSYRRRLDTAEPQSDFEQMRSLRAESHAHASTSMPGGGPLKQQERSPSAAECARIGSVVASRLEAHHYRQLAALCGAAITATQDADKVRANGVRAVGNLLALLTPDMAPTLAAAEALGSSTAADADALISRSASTGEREGAAAASVRRQNSGQQRSDVTGDHGMVVRGEWRTSGPGTRFDSNTSKSISGGGEGLELGGWLDGALTCLQSTLTTGGIKVQWNACCATHGLLRNSRLLAHRQVGLRVAPLLMLLLMLVRESANFKIRTHAAAALAALPCREAYGEVLADALLVVAGALESIVNGSAAVAAGAVKPVTDDSAVEQGDLEADVEGRFPNYRYSMGLSSQLRVTLLHLLALARPTDARRVRDALARKADFLHSCLQEQLAEALQPLRTAMRHREGSSIGGPDGELQRSTGIFGTGTAVVDSSGRGENLVVDVELPSDPFGLSGGRGSSPGSVVAAKSLSALLTGLSLGAEEAQSVDAYGCKSTGLLLAACGGKGGRELGLTLMVGDEEDELMKRTYHRIVALAASLRGFADVLSQLGPSVEPVLHDVRDALMKMPPPKTTR